MDICAHNRVKNWKGLGLTILKKQIVCVIFAPNNHNTSYSYKKHKQYCKYLHDAEIMPAHFVICSATHNIAPLSVALSGNDCQVP